MQYIDSHAHLYLPDFDEDREEVITRALNRDVTKILLPNIDMNSVEPMLKMVNNYAGVCFPMIGIHPTYVKEDYADQLLSVEHWINREKFIAIGEIGIDLYWDKEFLEEQIIAFRKQLEIALEFNLPVVIHCRESFDEISTIIDDFKGKGLKGVFHAFTGSIKQAAKVIDAGFMIGTGGIITFKNAGLDKTIAELGPDSIILETDSPYLAPVPYRGKKNESSYIPIIAGKIGELTGKSHAEIAEITTLNAIKLFNLD